MSQKSISNFSLQGYRNLLVAFKEAGYSFQKFQNVQLKDATRPIAILRHDIDFGLRGTYDIAKIENEEEVESTFFFQIRSPLYNILSDYASHVIRTIYDFGHDIALHFDLSLYGENFSNQLKKELEILEYYFPFANTAIISFHRPGSSSNLLQNVQLPNGITHTYNKLYFHQLSYFTDSRGQWNNGYPPESHEFSERRSMQVLTHPLWWTEAGEDSVAKIEGFVKQKREETLDYLEKTAISFSLARLRR